MISGAVTPSDKGDDSTASSTSTLGHHDLFSIEQQDIVEAASNLVGQMTQDPAAAAKVIPRKSGELVSIESTKYMYISEDMGWVRLTSEIAAKKMCSMLDLFAPVNFIKATKPVIDALMYYEVPIIVLGQTFSMGHVRCHFWYTYNDNGRMTHMNLKAAVPLNGIPDCPDPAMIMTARWSYCVCPPRVSRVIKKIRVPKNISLSKGGYLCRWIHNVFESDSETILWIIGDILADFGNKRLFIFYGPGGVGKTSVVNIIASISSSVVVEIPGRLAAKKSGSARNYGNTVTEELKARLSNTRLALIGDVEVTSDDEHLNVQMVKEITGGDEGTHGKVSVTGLMSVNKLFHYEFMTDYTRADRTRRIVVVPMVHEWRQMDQHFVEPSIDDKLELISLSIATRVKYDMKPPLSTKSDIQ
jgi:hypothetical protein